MHMHAFVSLYLDLDLGLHVDLWYDLCIPVVSSLLKKSSEEVF